jgi:RNA polymerase sigma-70 factor (ECF subfamily)
MSGAALSSTPPLSLNVEQVFNRHFDQIYRFLYRRVGNREDAEDLTSEVFLKASRQLDTGRSEVSILSWLFTVARTVLSDHWRRYYREGAHVVLEDLYAAELPEEESVSETPHAAERIVADILAALPENYRRVLELRFLYGYSIRDTATHLGITPGNVKVLQHRALARAVRTGA